MSATDTSRRLKTSREWAGVRRLGRCSGDEYVLICALCSREVDRFGFTTSKGFHRAVDRNRARRRIREAFKQVYGVAFSGCDIIGVAKRKSLDASFEDLKLSIQGRLVALRLTPQGEGD